MCRIPEALSSVGVSHGSKVIDMRARGVREPIRIHLYWVLSVVHDTSINYKIRIENLGFRSRIMRKRLSSVRSVIKLRGSDELETLATTRNAIKCYDWGRSAKRGPHEMHGFDKASNSGVSMVELFKE